MAFSATLVTQEGRNAFLSQAATQYRAAYRQMASKPGRWVFVATASGGMLTERSQAAGRTPLVRHVQTMSEMQFLGSVHTFLEACRQKPSKFPAEWLDCQQAKFNNAFDSIFKGDV